MSVKTLDGKVAFVTGGTAGIGRETAVTLAREGAKVVLTGRRETEGVDTVRMIREAGGEGAFIRADVSVEQEVKDAIEGTVARYGRLDVAFNNAGVEAGGPIPEITREIYDKVFDINVWGVLVSLKYEIPALLESGGGSIVNVSSVAGQVGMPGVSAYVASKHAVEGLTKVAALEYAPQGVRVNAIAPALIDTDMADRFAGKRGEDSRARIAALHPIGRSGRPSEVAAAVLWLVSDASSFVTGHTLMIDGGWTAQ